MATLLLRLAAPLMSWGDNSKFETRRTLREPTKSAVLGLVGAALGVRREDSRAWLASAEVASLRFGLRADQEGAVLRDYHTARGKDTYITYRYYLQDAVFLVGLESPDEAYLHTLEDALRHPVFPLFLGRRSCPPTQPLVLGLRPCSLEEALRQEPWLCSAWAQKRIKKASLRIVTDAAPGESALGGQWDAPRSFDRRRREHTFRPVALRPSAPVGVPEHDPMAELEANDGIE